MSLPTARELEFLASLNTRWSRLYSNELARLLNEDDVRCDRRHEPNFIIRISAAHIWRSRRNFANTAKT